MTTTIEQIKEALRQHIAEAEAATPGPWEAFDGVVASKHIGGDYFVTCDSPRTSNSQDNENATFIAHARTMSPLVCEGLLRVIEWMEEDCEMDHQHQQIAQNRLEQIVQTWNNQTTQP